MSVKPKPLKDIRYAESIDVPGPGKPLPSGTTELVGIPKAAHRIGQRVACMLNAEGFSVGTYDHVYIAFTPALPEKKIVPTGFGVEQWQRYVACGVAQSFKSLAEEEKMRFIESATFDVLRALRPEQSPSLDSVYDRLKKFGARARILRAAKDTKDYHFDVSFDVPPWQETAYLYVTALNTASGEITQATPFPLSDFDDAFPLVSSITFAKGILRLNPRKSFRAGLSTRNYQTPIQFNVAAFAAQQDAQEDAPKAARP